MNNIPFLPISQHKMVFYPPLWACILCLWDNKQLPEHNILCFADGKIANVEEIDGGMSSQINFEDFLKTHGERSWEAI